MNIGKYRPRGVLKAARDFFARTGDGSGKRPAAVSFSGPALAVAAAVLVCAVGWAFFMGLMVGRGQNPVGKINDLTGGLLETEQEETAEANPQDILEIPGEERARPVVAPEREKPEGVALEAWPATAPPKKTAPKSKAEKPKPVNRTVYDFVYQAAALKTAGDAESLNKKLKGLGLRSETKKSGKVYLCLVSLRGTETDALTMRDKLRSAKLGKPLLLSKKERPARQGNKK
ncbi:MAG: SPOR domain-containing protein [Desulfovibrio sp.]|nr:SPOR domain-containing protein [Desulfovibrio sp.]